FVGWGCPAGLGGGPSGGWLAPGWVWLAGGPGVRFLRPFDDFAGTAPQVRVLAACRQVFIGPPAAFAVGAGLHRTAGLVPPVRALEATLRTVEFAFGSVLEAVAPVRIGILLRRAGSRPRRSLRPSGAGTSHDSDSFAVIRLAPVALQGCSIRARRRFGTEARIIRVRFGFPPRQAGEKGNRERGTTAPTCAAPATVSRCGCSTSDGPRPSRPLRDAREGGTPRPASPETCPDRRGAFAGGDGSGRPRWRRPRPGPFASPEPIPPAGRQAEEGSER